jgi:hypothetical protein
MDLALTMAKMKTVPADSGVWFPGTNIQRILFAVDAGSAELLIAKQLKYDALIGHHPVGEAKLGFPKVVRRHLNFMLEMGVPRKVAEMAVNELEGRLSVRAHPANYMHEVDEAKILRMPFMNIHLPIDQVTRGFLLERIERSKSETVGELIKNLGRIPEFKNAKTKIELRMGEEDLPLGRWVLVFAAGTNGGYPVAKAYFDHGIDTVIYLHVDNDELVKIRRDCKGSLIVLGHMAGDSIGINLFLEQLAKRGTVSDKIGVIT